jgi:hypothetical protein
LIKGVTKNVIEINNLNSRYFERAFVVLKPDCSLPDSELRKEAELSLGSEPPSFAEKNKFNIFVKMLFSGVIGAIISVILCIILYLFV